MFDCIFYKHLIFFGLSVQFALSTNTEMIDKTFIIIADEGIKVYNLYFFLKIISIVFRRRNKFKLFSTSSFRFDGKKSFLQKYFNKIINLIFLLSRLCFLIRSNTRLLSDKKIEKAF